jgi:copper homeostasis protein
VTLVEVALDDVAGVRVAEAAGAGRLEICAALADVGGITPSLGFVQEVVARVERIPIVVLIRPRGGDFVYAPDEVRVMVRDIAALRELGVGFAVGALTPEGDLDEPAMRELLAATDGAPVTFHRAIDSTRDLVASVDRVAELGADRVLTTGGRRTALEGAEVLRALVERTAGRVTIVAGGSVRATNAARLVAASGVTELHLRAAVERDSRATWSRPGQDYDTVRVSATDGDLVRAVVAAVAGAPA